MALAVTDVVGGSVVCRSLSPASGGHCSQAGDLESRWCQLGNNGHCSVGKLCDCGRTVTRGGGPKPKNREPSVSLVTALLVRRWAPRDCLGGGDSPQWHEYIHPVPPKRKNVCVCVCVCDWVVAPSTVFAFSGTTLGTDSSVDFLLVCCSNSSGT